MYKTKKSEILGYWNKTTQFLHSIVCVFGVLPLSVDVSVHSGEVSCLTHIQQESESKIPTMHRFCLSVSLQ